MATIKAENWDGAVSGWTFGAGVSTGTGGSPPSSPNALFYAGPSNQVDQAVYSAAQDGNSGNCRATTKFRFESSGGNAQIFLTVRKKTAGADLSDWQAATCYCIRVMSPSGAFPGIRPERVVSGSATALGTAVGAIADSTWYLAELAAVGSGASTAIKVRVGRVSDGFWMNSSGTFVSDPAGTTYAFSLTDGGGGAVDGQGYTGIAFYADAATTLRADDYLFETVAGGAAATPASTLLLLGCG